MITPSFFSYAISSYFRNGPGSEELTSGIEMLVMQFQWYLDRQSGKWLPPKVPIMHQEFFHILLKICDVIDNTDKPFVNNICNAC